MITSSRFKGKSSGRHLPIFIVCTSIAFCLVNFKISAQLTRVKLKDAITITLNSHPNSTIAKNNAAIAAQKVREGRAAFLPSVTINTNSDYNLKLQTSIIPAGTFGPEEIEMRMGSPISSGATVQADLTLVDQSARMGLVANKIDKEIADLNLLKENETLIYNTALAFFEVLSYAEKAKLLKENENQNDQLMNIVKLRYEQGVAKKSEYDRARVNLNSVKADLSLNESKHHLAINKLKNAMGIDLQSKLTIDDSIHFSVPTEMPKGSYLDLRNLVTYRIDERNLQLKELDVKRKRAAFLPTVSLYGKYGANAFGDQFTNAYDKWIGYSSIGVKLSIPVFSGFKKRSQLAQSQLSVENQHLTTIVNEDSYRLEYENTNAQVLSYYNNFSANKENLSLASEVLKATALEYREGSADLSSYMEAESSYKEAESDYTTALLDLLTSKLAFEKANGTLGDYLNKLN